MTAVDDLWSRLEVEVRGAFASYRARLSTLAIGRKVDNTFLTEADIAIQDLIERCIREVDPSSPIIGEEDHVHEEAGKASVPDRFWVIDPIDGTSEFIDPARRDFCSVVCLVQQGFPTASFVFAPELINGASLTLKVDTISSLVDLNGTAVRPHTTSEPSLRASVTRSDQRDVRAFDGHLAQAGYWAKTKATSQTIDLIRTCVDLDRWTDNPSDARFDFFWRERQKIWDGLAGLCLARTLGLSFVDARGRPRLPVTAADLARAEPSFDCTIIGRAEAVRWFLSLL